MRPSTLQTGLRNCRSDLDGNQKEDLAALIRARLIGFPTKRRRVGKNGHPN